jgi:hypothetical protein
MNKLEYKGKEILDIDKVKKSIEDTNTNTETLKTKVTSEDITKIVVVTEYPTTEENGVLYIKVES